MFMSHYINFRCYKFKQLQRSKNKTEMIVAIYNIMCAVCWTYLSGNVDLQSAFNMVSL